MNKEKEIRFLYPPLLLMGSILLGIAFDQNSTLNDIIVGLIGSDTERNTLITLLGATSLILVSGFIIGTITILFLKLICFKNGFEHEIWIKEELYSSIGKIILKMPHDLNINKSDRLYASVTFDHEFIPQAIHEWIARRWNSFYVSANSAVALVMSLVIGGILNIEVTLGWILVTCIFILIFICFGYTAWKQTMRMIEFQINVKDKSVASERSPD